MAENVINLSEAEALSGNQDSDFSSFSTIFPMLSKTLLRSKECLWLSSGMICRNDLANGGSNFSKNVLHSKEVFSSKTLKS